MSKLYKLLYKLITKLDLKIITILTIFILCLIRLFIKSFNPASSSNPSLKTFLLFVFFGTIALFFKLIFKQSLIVFLGILFSGTNINLNLTISDCFKLLLTKIKNFFNYIYNFVLSRISVLLGIKINKTELNLLKKNRTLCYSKRQRQKRMRIYLSWKYHNKNNKK